MELTSLIIPGAIILVVFLVMHLVMKSLKTLAMIAIAALVLGIWLYGFSGFFDKVSDVKEKIPELDIQKVARSVTGCTADEECAYVIDSGDCREAAGYCNNVFKEENYKKVLNEEVLEEECNRTSIQLNYTIDCECKLHKEREGRIKQWINKIVEKEAGYTYCWKKETAQV